MSLRTHESIQAALQVLVIVLVSKYSSRDTVSVSRWSLRERKTVLVTWMEEKQLEKDMITDSDVGSSEISDGVPNKGIFSCVCASEISALTTVTSLQACSPSFLSFLSLDSLQIVPL